MIKAGQSYKFFSSSRDYCEFSGQIVKVIKEDTNRDPEIECLWVVETACGRQFSAFASEISGEIENTWQYFDSKGRWKRTLCFSCENRPKKYATGLCEFCNQFTVKADLNSELGPNIKAKKVYSCVSEVNGEFACILAVRSSLESAKKIPEELGYEKIIHSNHFWQKGECKITISEDDLPG